MADTRKTFKIPADLSAIVIGNDMAKCVLFRDGLQKIGVNIIEVYDNGRDALERAAMRSFDLTYIVAEPSDMALMTLIRGLRSGASASMGAIKLLVDHRVVFSRDESKFFHDYTVQLLHAKLADTRLVGADLVHFVCSMAEPTSLQKRINDGKRLIQEGLLKEAKTLFLELDSDHEYVVTKVGLLRTAKDDAEMYWKKIKELVSTDPKNYNFKFEMIDRYMAEGRAEEASRMLDNVMAEVEEDPEIYWLTELGVLCLGLKFYTHCFRIAKVIRNRAPQTQSWRADLILARAYLATGDAPESKRCLTRAVSAMKRPTAESANLLAIHARRNSQFEEALEHYKSALQLSVDDYRIHFNIGLCFELLERKDEAENHFRKALEIYPGYAKAKAKLARG